MACWPFRGARTWGGLIVRERVPDATKVVDPALH
jgi:hypothetical protein